MPEVFIADLLLEWQIKMSRLSSVDFKTCIVDVNNLSCLTGCCREEVLERFSTEWQLFVDLRGNKTS